MFFGTPRGRLKVNTGHPGGFGILGRGTLTFINGTVRLTATQRVPAAWTMMVGLICIPIVLYIAWYSHHLRGPIAPLFSLPLSGFLLARTGTILLAGATICNVILARNRVQFTSSPESGGPARTVYLVARNTADAEAIRARLAVNSASV